MFPDIHFNLLGHEINIFTYSLFMAVGFLVFFYELEKHIKKDTFFENEVENIRLVVTFTFIFGFICAGILPNFIFKTFSGYFLLYSVMPGFLMGSVFFLLSLKLIQINAFKWSNILIPFWCYTHAWGRLGCFFAGCCFGKKTDLFLGVSFNNEFFKDEIGEGIAVHPTQLYESLILFFLGFILKRFIPINFRVSFFLVLYGSSRFIIEFIRYEIYQPNINFYNLTSSQLFSIIYALLGFILFLKIFRKNSYKNI